jgi:acyl-CoA thioester hydrolase
MKPVTMFLDKLTDTGCRGQLVSQTSNGQGQKETAVPDPIIAYRGTVYPWQCDHMDHMNVMWYVGKFDEATWQLLSSLGLSRSRFSKEGTGMAAVEQHIVYSRELRAGDLVTIRSAVIEVKEKAIRLAHEMRNDETGEVVATTTIVGVHLDSTSRKARHLPSDVRERAKIMIEEQAEELIPDNNAGPRLSRSDSYAALE